MMADTASTKSFAAIIEHFTSPSRTRLETFLAGMAAQLREGESALVLSRASQALNDAARLKLNRVLLLELHAAKLAGELTASGDDDGFDDFVERSRRPEFAAHLDRRYPPLLERLETSLHQQEKAIEAIVQRLVHDRAAIASLIGRPPGRLVALGLGHGDLHAGGQAVARLTFEHGIAMYKPRSLRVDVVLDRLLAATFTSDARIRVPRVVERDDYGWTEFIEHRYCEGDGELRLFYLRLGHWLAVMRLLGGTDIHLENLIAHGPTPIVIDVESLFSPLPEAAPSGYGKAHDLAESIVRSSVLRTGMVPYRAPALGFDGVDMSAAGALPNQQPQVSAPIIANEGTTDAHVEIVSVDINVAQNHPSPNPQVALYWNHISEGFLEASATFRDMDSRGELTPLIDAFEGCLIRDIRRPTQAYSELGRMLWHPASLHDEAKAIERARDLFARNALVVPIAPSSHEEIMREIHDLRFGDIPVFVSPLGRDRIDAALADWRSMRVELEEMTIRSALVVTELNVGADESEKQGDILYFARHPHTRDLDARRRTLAAAAVERLIKLSVRGDDDSVTWITPETTNAGWTVQPLQADSYFGLGGVLFALAGYQHEVTHGRANAVDGLDRIVDGSLRVMQALDQAEPPGTFGGLSGFGGRIWTWLALHDLTGHPEWLQRAEHCAGMLDAKGFDEDRLLDYLDGTSGSIIPLCHLADATGDPRWRALAAKAASHIEAQALVDERGARWHTLVFNDPIGGFAHGATGIGWALARLALTEAGAPDDRRRWQMLAQQAFAFQDSLFDEELGNWLDARQLTRVKSFHTWCNGSVGIGLAAADLFARTGDPRYQVTLRRAVAASRNRWGANHTLCHGDFSLWELFVRAASADPEGCASDVDETKSQVVSAIEEHGGVIGGMTRAAFTPGLMTGLAGAVHSFNRMHPECRLPSPLLLERMKGRN
jgi:type 2 lantibiotic biosynthesis protein LanM